MGVSVAHSGTFNRAMRSGLASRSCVTELDGIMWYKNARRPRRIFAKTDSAKELCPSDAGDQKDTRNADGVKSVSFSENVRQYLLNSTLHGLRYVGETHITVFERAFFLLAFLLVIMLSVYFISNIYQKWSASPIIIGLNAVATSIGNFPFPAVTVCNMNQARRSIVEGFAPDSVDYALLENLCGLDPPQAKEGTESIVRPDFTGSWRVFRKFLLDVSQPCSEMLLFCGFATRTEPCMELFNTVLTDDGLCCTFNSVHPMFLYQQYNATNEFDSVNNNGDLVASDWTPEKGWPNAGDDEYGSYGGGLYPRPASGAGSHMGLIVVLNASMSDYYCSSTNSKGFRVLLHNPTETPKITDYGFSITTGKETRVVINPRLSDASVNIKSIPTAQRQCVFANEGNLSYFRTYSRKNCEMECESRIIEQVCGCVQYFMPQTHADTTICSHKDSECYEEVSLAIDLALNATFACSCLPGCFEIYYKPSMYTSTLGTGKFTMRNKFLNNVEEQELNSSIAVMHIYYEESIFRSNTKEELIGFTEFLSSTGGLLGLFMGFSVVSLIEIIYFVSLRPYCAHRRLTTQGRQEKNAGQPVTNVREKSPIAIVNAWYMSGTATPIKVSKTDDVMMVMPTNKSSAVPPKQREAVDAAAVVKPTAGQSIGQRWRAATQWLTDVLYDEDRRERAGRMHHRYPYTE